MKYTHNEIIYRQGDRIQHKLTLAVYTVSHVVIASYTLKVATTDGEIFNVEDIVKI